MQVTFDHKVQIAPDIWTFYFRGPAKHDYIAGQYTELTLPHENPDDRGTRRWFTLSSSPSEDLLCITTRHQQPASTFKNTLWQLEPESEIHLADPMGDFVLPKDSSIPLLFVVGGIGVTPVHSILKWLADNSEKRRIDIIYAAEDEQHLIFRDLIDQQSDTVDYYLSSPSEGWQGHAGRITAQTILDKHTDPHQLVFISGPEPMVESLTNGLLTADVPERQLVRDYFPGYN